MEHRLQSSNMPRVYRASQPAICLEDKTGTFPCNKTQLGDSTAAEEELFPNNKGYVRACVRVWLAGRVAVFQKRIVRM